MKVAVFFWDVCRDVVLGKYRLEDIGLVISPTMMKDEEEAKEICEMFASWSWSELMTEEERHEYEGSHVADLYWQIVNTNCQKAKDVFWEIWNSGKMLQPRLMFGDCIVTFDLGKVYDSVESYIEYLEKSVCPYLVNTPVEEHQKEYIKYLRSL